MLPSIRGAAILLGVALLPFPARADIVHLKNGGELRGRVVEEHPKTIRLEIPYGHITVRRVDIREIEPESDLSYYLGNGEILLQRRAYRGALRLYVEAHRIDPASGGARRGVAEAWLGIGREMVEKKRLHAALDAFSRSVDALPDRGDEARRLERYVRQVLSDAGRLEEEGNAALAAGDLDVAARKLQDAVAFDPSRRPSIAPALGDARIGLAGRAYRAGRYAEAARLYDQAVRLRPERALEVRDARVYAHLQAVTPLLDGEDFEGARALVEALRYISPADPRLFHTLARIDRAEGDLIAARESYLRVVGTAGVDGDTTDLAELEAASAAALGPAPDPEADPALAEVSEEWEVLKLGSIRIHFRQADVALEVARGVENLIRTLPGFISPHPAPKPLDFDIWLHPDPASFAAEGGVGRASLEIRTDRTDVLERSLHLDLSDPQALTANLHREIGRLLHLAHQGYRQVHPPWVEEGLAARCEPVARRLRYIDIVADLYRSGETAPFTRLLQGASITGEEDRARAYVLVQYLIEQRGLEHFTLAIDDLMRHPGGRFLRLRYGMRTVQELQNRLRDWTIHRSPIDAPLPAEGG